MFVLSDVEKIANSDINRALLDKFLITYRHMNDEQARARLLKTMVERNMFYVPFDAYIKQVHGKELRKKFSEYYNQAGCLLTNSLCMPLVTVKDDVLGLLLNNPTIDEKYRYPMTGVFQKSRYLQMSERGLMEALQRKFVFIVEGVFDEISISSCGIPAIGLSGSSINWNLAQIINIIPTKIVCSDEDQAGKRMYRECQKIFSGKVISVKLPTKDIDEFLRCEENAKKFVDIVAANERTGWATRIVKLGDV